MNEAAAAWCAVALVALALIGAAAVYHLSLGVRYLARIMCAIERAEQDWRDRS